MLAITFGTITIFICTNSTVDNAVWKRTSFIHVQYYGSHMCLCMCKFLHHHRNLAVWGHIWKNFHDLLFANAAATSKISVLQLGFNFPIVLVTAMEEKFRFHVSLTIEYMRNTELGHLALALGVNEDLGSQPFLPAYSTCLNTLISDNKSETESSEQMLHNLSLPLVSNANKVSLILQTSLTTVTGTRQIIFHWHSQVDLTELGERNPTF